MQSPIRAENDALRFTFSDHTAELQRRVGAWFSTRLADLQEPLRALVAQRLFIHHEGHAIRDQLLVQFSLSFQRTLRVPDDGKDYPLPAGLGRLPVRSVRAAKSDQIPPAWRQTPTTIVPLHHAEATWLSFSGCHPFAVQIAAGGICAASGLAHVPGLSRNPQNYLSIPTQPWLDGFRVDADTVRQFVAMPLGHGYTVEGQLTGEEKRGGVQIRVVPPTVDALWESKILPLCEQRWAALIRPCGPGDDILEDRRHFGIEFSTSMVCEEESGFGAGGRIRQKIYADRLPPDTWDEIAALSCEAHLIPANRWPELTGEAVPTQPPSPRDYAEAGLPWFDYANAAPALTTPAVLADIKTVSQLFKAKSGHEIPDNVSIAPPKTTKL